MVSTLNAPGVEHMFDFQVRSCHDPDGGSARMAPRGTPTRRARVGAQRGRLAARHLPTGVPVLARFAVLHVEACQAAVRRGLSEARAELRDVTDHDTVEAAVETWHAESARLMGERRAVGLVEEALRGRRYVARL
jgi:hypothetical protein